MKSPSNHKKEVVLEVYIYARWNDSESKLEYFVYPYDTTSYNKENILIESKKLTISVPAEANTIAKLSTSLKEQKKTLMAKQYQEVQKLQATIDRMLALDYIPLDTTPQL